MSLYDNSDIPVLCRSAESLDSCFAFHDFHLLFTETVREDCKLIYKDSQPNVSLFQRHTQTRACRRRVGKTSQTSKMH